MLLLLMIRTKQGGVVCARLMDAGLYYDLHSAMRNVASLKALLYVCSFVPSFFLALRNEMYIYAFLQRLSVENKMRLCL